MFKSTCALLALTMSVDFIFGQAPQVDIVLQAVRSRRESLPPCAFLFLEKGSRTWGKLPPFKYQNEYRISTTLHESLFVKTDGTSTAILRQHEVVFFDGESTVIQGTGIGTGAYVYDPRVLGLAIGPFENTEMETALRLNAQVSGSVEYLKFFRYRAMSCNYTTRCKSDSLSGLN